MDGLGNGFENNNTAIRAARKAANSIKDAITDEISKVNAKISSIQKESEERQAKEELAQGWHIWMPTKRIWAQKPFDAKAKEE